MKERLTSSVHSCSFQIILSFITWLLSVLAWENSRHLATLLISPPNGVWSTSAEIPYWWRGTTQIWVVTRHQYRISALVSQTSFCGETSGGAPRNVGCFLKLSANLLASFFSKILFFWNESFATTRSSFSLEKNKNVFNFNNLLFHASLSLLLKKLMVIPVL